MFKGAYTALVTPIRDGQLDTEAIARLVEDQIAAGIHGLVPCGTTGEASTLSHTEHIKVVQTVVQAAAGRVPVLAGAGSNSTREAVELALACKELGVAGTLQITPYYNKPTQDGLVAHFVEIANKTDLPLVVYNVPSRTGTDLLPETVARLAEHPRVVGIKEATGSMTRAARIRELCGDGFALLSGDDFSLLPLLSLGGDGVISVGSNVAPSLYSRLCEAVQEGRWDEARALHYQQLPLSRAMFASANPIPAKTALAMLGKIAPEFRLPMHPLPESSPVRAQIQTALEALELQPKAH